MYATKTIAPIFFLCFLSSRFASVLGGNNIPILLEEATDDPSAEAKATGLRHRSLEEFGITEVRGYKTNESYVKLEIGGKDTVLTSEIKSIRVLGKNLNSVKFFHTNNDSAEFQEKSAPFYLCGDWYTNGWGGFKDETFPSQCSASELPQTGTQSYIIMAYRAGSFSGSVDLVRVYLDFSKV